MTQKYTDTGLTNGTRYFYTVTAVNTAGESPNSIQASAIPAPVRTLSWYTYGAPSTAYTLDQIAVYAKQAWASFKTLCLTQTGMPSGMGAGAWRVKVPDQNDPTTGRPNGTFSEGIGYGMFLAVYFMDPTSPLYDSAAAGIFQGLWTYYKFFRNSNGLMNWRIDDLGNITGTGGATDADQDVAYSLVIYNRKYETAKTDPYGAAATALINAIDQFEFVPHTDASFPDIMTNGDQWGMATNRYMPDYAHPAAWKAFGEHTGNTTRWTNIASANQALATTYFYNNFQTGYVPDGCSRTGQPLPAGQEAFKYGYNSIRMPFRNALSWFNNGDAIAGNMLKKLAGYEQNNVSTNNGQVASTYAEPAMDGSSNGGYINIAYASGYGLAGFASSSTLTLGNSAVPFLQQQNDSSYFGNSLRAIAYLIMTGEARVYTPNAATIKTASAQLRTRVQLVGARTTTQFNLVRSDLFTSTIDPTYWYVRDGFAGDSGDGQYSASCVSLVNGVVQMTPSLDNIPGLESTIGGITYGKWDVWFKWDATQGYLPRMYLYPDDLSYSEGDIEFMRGIDSAGGFFEFLAHNTSGNPTIAQVQQTISQNVKNGFVKLSLEWLPTSITLRVNDIQVLQTLDAQAIPTNPCHLVIQEDVGITNGHNGVNPRPNYPAALTVPTGSPAGTPTPTSTLFVDRVDIYRSSTLAPTINAVASLTARGRLQGNATIVKNGIAQLKLQTKLSASTTIAKQASGQFKTAPKLTGTSKVVLLASGQIRTRSRLQATAVRVIPAGGSLRLQTRFQGGPPTSVLVAAASLVARTSLSGGTPQAIVRQFSTAHISFGPQSMPDTPAGYTLDYGVQFSLNQGYGWEQGTLPTTQNATGNLRAQTRLQAAPTIVKPAAGNLRTTTRLQGSTILVKLGIGQLRTTSRLQGSWVLVKSAVGQLRIAAQLQGGSTRVVSSSASLGSRTRLQGAPTYVIVAGTQQFRTQVSIGGTANGITVLQAQAALATRNRLQGAGVALKSAAATLTNRTRLQGSAITVYAANAQLRSQLRLQGSTVLAKLGVGQMKQQTRLQGSTVLVKLAVAQLLTRNRLQGTAAIAAAFQSGSGSFIQQARIQGTGNTFAVQTASGSFSGRAQLSGTATQQFLVDDLIRNGDQVDWAYAFCKIAASATKAFVLLRSADNATTDIGFDSAGNPDQTAINAWCSPTSSTGLVAKMYDQSGNGRDASQSTTTNMPRIYESGAVNTVTTNSVVRVAARSADNSRGLVSTTLGTPYTGSSLWGEVVALINNTTGSISTRYLSFCGAANTDNNDREGSAMIERNGGGSTPSQGFQWNRNLTQKSNVSGTYGKLNGVIGRCVDGSYYQLSCAGVDGTAAGDTVGAFSITNCMIMGAANRTAFGSVTGAYQSEAVAGMATLSDSGKAIIRAHQAAYYGVS